MPVRLSVVNEDAEHDAASTHRFSEVPITVGRREDNHLTLADPKRIVSGRHAVIRRRNGTYCLVDQESKNFTYVEDRRLPAGEPHELDDGEVFRVGDFRITFHGWEEESPTGDNESAASVPETAPPEPTAALKDALETLVAAHRALPAEREHARQAALNEVVDSPAVRTSLRRALSALDDPPSAPADDPGPSAPSGRDENGPSTPSVTDLLAEAVAVMVRIPWRFRHEFIGQTMRRDPEMAFLYRGKGRALREALEEASLSEDTRRRRLEAVREAAEALVRHQIAMLEGYRAGVEAGTERLLTDLDPDAHRREASGEHPLGDYLPALGTGAVLERVQEAWEEIRRADAATVERRVFRPAFTKAYLARMTAPPSDEPLAEGDVPTEASAR